MHARQFSSLMAIAALAAAALKDLGFTDVRHMGGFKDWADKGLPVDKV